MSKAAKLGLHEKALKAFGVIVRTDKERRAQNIVNHHRDRKKEEIVNHITPMLREMQAAFDRGETLGGAPSLKVWCKMYKHEGVLTYARCRQLLTGKTGHENRAVKPLDPFLQHIAEAKQKVGDIQRAWDAPFKNGEVRDGHVLDQISPIIDSVYEEFLALIAPDGYEVMKADRGWWVQEKHEEPATKIVGTKLSTKRGGGDATVAPAPKTVKGKEKKTHATGRERDAKRGRTRCQKEISEVTIDDKNPTCRLCQTSIEQDEHLKNGEEFDALIKSVKITEKERRAAWMDFVNAKHGFIRGKTEFEWLPDKEQAVLVLKNPLHFVKPQATVTVVMEPDKPVVKPLVKLVEGEYGTKLRTEAANAAYGEKKVSKKVYQRILAGVEKYQEYWRSQMPPMPVRPENATEVCEHDGEIAAKGYKGSGYRGMIISTSPEYDAWIAADAAAHQTPEYLAWDAESQVIGKLWGALVQRYDPLMEGDLDGDDQCEGVAAD